MFIFALWSPAVDISETETEYLLKAQLPAVNTEDVHVTYDDGMLTISGERKQEKERKGAKVPPRRKLPWRVLALLRASRSH